MTQKKINNTLIELTQGDITHQHVDAIVNAANSGLLGGGGVDGAIHRAGGPEIIEECRKIRSTKGKCPTGEAVITAAGKLNAKYVIHTVGPVWRGGNEHEPEKLTNAYRNSLKLADKHNVKKIAFPSISTGVYSYPVDYAAIIALKTITNYLKGDTNIELVRFVLFDIKTFKAYQKALSDI